MAAEPTEVRMARLEGAFQQINGRLGAVELRLGAVEQRLGAVEQRLSAEIGDLRRQMMTQFYWLLTFVLGSILVPILRDLVP